MNVLLGVIALFAIMSLIAAAVQAAAIVRLAPANQKLGSFMLLGWWKFGQLEVKAGAAAAQHLNIYKRAVIAFLVFVVLGVILSGWIINQRPPAAATAAMTTDPRVIPADFAFNIDLRRVANMPGAPILES